MKYSGQSSLPGSTINGTFQPVVAHLAVDNVEEMDTSEAFNVRGGAQARLRIQPTMQIAYTSSRSLKLYTTT